MTYRQAIGWFRRAERKGFVPDGVVSMHHRHRRWPSWGTQITDPDTGVCVILWSQEDAVDFFHHEFAAYQ